MPLFLAPLPSSSTIRHSQPSNLRIRLSASRPQRKRKHSSSESESSSSSVSSSEDERPDAATNPLSLTPDEIAQYKLAGLSLDKPLPRATVSGWPHKGLPSATGVDPKTTRRKTKSQAKGKGIERQPETKLGSEDGDGDEEIEEDQTIGNSSLLRLQHFAVLTTILHKCLLEGDVKRAGRAWGLMLRMQVGGKGVDLRGTNYWGIGAELLIRSMDGTGGTNGSDSNLETDRDQLNQGEDNGQGLNPQLNDAKGRWGTSIGLQRAKDYYERLIIEHPFKRQFSSSVSALDFWPCMVACEIYGVQYEQNSSLTQVQRVEEQDIDEFEDLWQERDRIRQIALTAATQIAARLDERMTVPPYSDSHDLLRLRGMLALYIGDLLVPAHPEEDEMENAEGRDRRFLMRERASNHERGLKGRDEQQEKARGWFRKIERSGGDLSGIPEDILGLDEQDGL